MLVYASCMRRRRQPLAHITTVRLSETTYAALEQLADDLDISVSAYIRLLIDADLAQHPEGTTDAPPHP